MKTAVFADYKPTDALSASGFMADQPHGCGLVSNGIYIEMNTKLLLVDARGNPSVILLELSSTLCAS